MIPRHTTLPWNISVMELQIQSKPVYHISMSDKEQWDQDVTHRFLMMPFVHLRPCWRLLIEPGKLLTSDGDSSDTGVSFGPPRPTHQTRR